jgi:hypothetical protein
MRVKDQYDDSWLCRGWLTFVLKESRRRQRHKYGLTSSTIVRVLIEKLPALPGFTQMRQPQAMLSLVIDLVGNSSLSTSGRHSYSYSYS